MEIDPVAVAAAALFAKGLLDGFAGEAGRNTWVGLQRLATTVRNRLAAEPEGQAALALLEAKADDETRVQLLAQILQTQAQSDSHFHAELAELVDAAEEAGVISVTSANTGISAARDIKQLGGMMIGGNQINYGPNWSPRTGDKM